MNPHPPANLDPQLSSSLSSEPKGRVETKSFDQVGQSLHVNSSKPKDSYLGKTLKTSNSSDFFAQPSPGQFAAMDAFRPEDPQQYFLHPKNADDSDDSSVEIIVDADKSLPFHPNKASDRPTQTSHAESSLHSFWTPGVTASEFHDSNAPMHRGSVNNAPKRHKKISGAGSSMSRLSHRQMASNQQSDSTSGSKLSAGKSETSRVQIQSSLGAEQTIKPNAAKTEPMNTVPLKNSNKDPVEHRQYHDGYTDTKSANLEFTSVPPHLRSKHTPPTPAKINSQSPNVDGSLKFRRNEIPIYTPPPKVAASRKKHSEGQSDSREAAIDRLQTVQVSNIGIIPRVETLQGSQNSAFFQHATEELNPLLAGSDRQTGGVVNRSSQPRGERLRTSPFVESTATIQDRGEKLSNVDTPGENHSGSNGNMNAVNPGQKGPPSTKKKSPINKTDSRHMKKIPWKDASSESASPSSAEPRSGSSQQSKYKQIRDKCDSSDRARATVVDRWAANQAENHAANPILLDTSRQDFLQGLGLAGGDVELQAGIEASCHDTRLRESDVRELKAYKTAQHAIDETVKVQEIRETIQDRKREGRTKEERRAMRAALEADQMRIEQQESPREHKPKANIYMRPVEAKDDLQLTELYNAHVEASIDTAFNETLDRSYWQDTIKECEERKCPFIVAVLTQQKIKNHKSLQRLKVEPIVGFAYAVDYGQENTMHHFTVELEVWVHANHRREGIARTLLDRIMPALSPSYQCKDAVPFLDNNEPWNWTGGGRRLIKTITATLYSSKKTQAEYEKKKDWLSKSNFRMAGFIPKIGQKFGTE